MFEKHGILAPDGSNDPSPETLQQLQDAFGRYAAGGNRRDGRLENSKEREQYAAAIAKFRAIKFEHLLRPRFDKQRPHEIQRTAAMHGIELPSTAAAFIKYLRRNPIS